MKSPTHALLFALMLALFPGMAVPETPSSSATSTMSTLIVHVGNIHGKAGVIRLLVFNTQDGWPDEKSKSFRHASLPANGGSLSFILKDMPAGSYGISVLHDENENHKLDRDLLGRPKEGIGFGNNPKIGFTKPSLKDSSVRVSGPSTQTEVDLRYP